VSKTLHGLCKKAKPLSKGSLVANKSSGFFEKELGYYENTIIRNRRGTVIHKNFESNVIELFL
jgi:hypothetical protein